MFDKLHTVCTLGFHNGVKVHVQSQIFRDYVLLSELFATVSVEGNLRNCWSILHRYFKYKFIEFQATLCGISRILSSFLEAAALWVDDIGTLKYFYTSRILVLYCSNQSTYSIQTDPFSMSDS